MTEPRGEILRSGIPVSAGIAIGRAYLVGRDALRAPRHHVDAEEVEHQVSRLDRAIASSDRQLAKVKAKLASEDETDYHIIEAHQLMLHDEHLVVAAKTYIRTEHICAEWAVRKAVDNILAVFESIEDEYLQERRSDIEFVFERILRNLLGREDLGFDPPPDAIVVAYDLSPMDATQLHKAAVAGLITDAGGKTSHTAIIARAHELPAVVGLEDVCDVVEEDDLLIVDGSSGVVVINPTAVTVGRYREEQRRQVAAGVALRSQRDLPAVTRDGVVVRLFANLDGPDEAKVAADVDAAGVGLFRTEFLYMTSGELPNEETHYQAALDIMRALPGRPVTIRTFDLGADKLAGFLEEAALDEPNPALGLRSIRLCLHELGRSLFRSQLRGLLRAAAHGPLRLMFPMISGVAELRAARAVLAEVKAALARDGVEHQPDVPVGIMIEMPSAALIADVLAHEVDFFSIGTNDLIQYTLAVDRVNENVSYLYEPLHPSLLRLLRMVAEGARKTGIPVSVCGELAGDPLMVPVLIGLGLCDLSMSSVSIPEVKAAVRAVSAAEARGLVDRIAQLPTADLVRAAVVEFAVATGLPGRRA